jgi:hypothetical protein
MSRRALVNLILLGIVVFLTALAYFAPGDSGAPTPLTERSPAGVTRVRIERPPDTDIRIERTPLGWHMRQPLNGPVDTPRLGRLLQILSTPSQRRFPVDPTRLDDYGLASQLARLTLDDRVLEIGGSEPLGRLRYVRYGDQIHLIEDQFLPLLLGAPESFLDHRLLPRDAVVASVRLPAGEITAGSPETDTWLNSWTETRAVQVLAAPKTPGTETLEIRLQHSRKPILFELLADGDWRLLIDRDRGLAYRLPADSLLLTGPRPIGSAGTSQ